MSYFEAFLMFNTIFKRQFKVLIEIWINFYSGKLFKYDKIGNKSGNNFNEIKGVFFTIKR